MTVLDKKVEEYVGKLAFLANKHDLQLQHNVVSKLTMLSQLSFIRYRDPG